MTQQNSLLGNVKHNSVTMMEQTQSWLVTNYLALLGETKKLSRHKSARSLKRLMQIAREHAVSYPRNISQTELVRCLELVFNRRLADVL